jgi:hypothetical protein
MGCTVSYPIYPKEARVITPEMIQQTLQKIKSLIQPELFTNGHAEYDVSSFITVDSGFVYHRHNGMVLSVPKTYKNGGHLIANRAQICEALKEVIPTPFIWKLKCTPNPFKWDPNDRTPMCVMKIQLVMEPLKDCSH